MEKLLYIKRLFEFSFLILIFAVSTTSVAQTLQSKAIIQKVLEKGAAAKGYEVEVTREKSRWATPGAFSELRGKPRAQVMEQGQMKRSLKYKTIRTQDAKIKHMINTQTAAKQSRTAKPPTEDAGQGAALQSQEALQGEQEAVFTVDPEDLFAKIEQSEVTELARTDDQVVLKVGSPPGPTPPGWPDMWLRATFDTKRNVLIKSELIVEGESRIITDFNYKLVEDKHWLPSRKTIRIIEQETVTVIDDSFGKYQKLN